MAAFEAYRSVDMIAAAEDMIDCYDDGRVVSSNRSSFYIHKIGISTRENMTVFGSFSYPNSTSYPSSGRISGIIFNDERDGDPLTAYSDISISVADFARFVGDGDALGLLGRLYAGADIIAGSDHDDSLSGFGGDDRIDGGAGIDLMAGMAGNDSYVVDHAEDQIVEARGGGTDSVKSSVDHALRDHVEQLLLTGSAAIDGTGNALTNGITGNGAANRLDGGGGADRMVGGGGGDFYVVDHGGDRVVESSAGGGIDTTASSVSFILPTHVEKLVLVGADAINGTGNALANHITGNAAANRIDGRTGADTMSGGGGNDSYAVDQAGDRVIETSASGGIDSVRSTISYTLGRLVENLTLAGAAGIDGTGNGRANKITGNNAANLLQGELGRDLLIGGGGVDRFLFDTAPSSGNRDRILDFSTADDTILLDRTFFADIAANGPLAAGAFFEGTVAAEAQDRIVYDRARGQIWYDPDGSGAAAKILFAEVSAGLTLSHADFVGIG